jgi:hypothetical protein
MDEKSTDRPTGSLRDLERDPRWRLVKVLYIFIAVVVVITSGIAVAKSNSRTSCPAVVVNNQTTNDWWDNAQSCTPSANASGHAINPRLVSLGVAFAFLLLYPVLGKVYLYIREPRGGNGHERQLPKA